MALIEVLGSGVDGCGGGGLTSDLSSIIGEDGMAEDTIPGNEVEEELPNEGAHGPKRDAYYKPIWMTRKL